jgi:hypothetical protein
MRLRWLGALAATTVVFGVGMQAASAAVPAHQMARFKVVDGAFSVADAKWTGALSHLSSSPTVAQLSKPSVAFIPAIKTFDTGLAKIGFSGRAKTDVATVIKLNKELIGVLGSIHSVKSFETQFSALNSKYFAVQNALAKDLGIPAGDVQV